MDRDESDFWKDLQTIICDVVKNRLKRLHKGSSKTKTIIEVNRALGELRKLSAGEMPDYNNEWQALLYVSWYQFGHARLAAEIFRNIFDTYRCIDLSSDEPIHVFDLGSGALAAQIGLTAFLRERIELGYRNPEILVHNIDPSQALYDIGRDVWQRINLPGVTPFHYPTVNDMRSASTSRTILVAMHAVYDENLCDIAKSIVHLWNNHRPSVTVATVNCNKAHLMTQLNPEWNRSNSINISDPLPNQTSATMTTARREIRSKLLSWAKECHCNDTHAIDNLLENNVPAWPRDASTFLLG